MIARDTLERQAALLDTALTRKAEHSLRAFLELAWPVLEPGTPFLPGWHVDLLCEYLEEVTAGRITRLVINIPPRYGKSLLVSVCWPVWEWVRVPSRRYLFVSHSDTLASKHSLDRRRLVQSDWFRARWGSRVRLTRDQQAKAEFHNTRRGVMTATSMGAALTGKGGDRLVIDDPHSPDQAESDALRARANERLRHTLLTRLDDKRRGAIVLIMQRLHVDDLTGVCLDLGFEQVQLPALAPARTTIIFPRSGRTRVREIDEPLWPAREDREQIETMRRALGSYTFTGQYQQEPIPRTGGYFPRDWWSWYDDLPEHEGIYQTWDLTFKDTRGSDFVVGLVAARKGALVYLVDRWKGRADFVETCRAMHLMQTRYPQTRAVLVEDAANGPAVVSALQAKIRGLIAVTPQGGKEARAAAIQPWVEARQVYVPRMKTTDGRWRPEYAWVDDLVATCAAFPRGAHDDDVDALSQLLVWFMDHPVIAPAGIMRPPDPFLRPRFGLWPDGERRPMWGGYGRRGSLWTRADS